MTLRPAPDTMTHLTGLLPVAQGVAVIAALNQVTDRLRAAGDPRSRGQIMADTLVERVTGQAVATQTPVAVNLVVSASTLLGGDQASAHLEGHGQIPAELARDLVATSLEQGLATWLRTVYAGPHGGLVAMASRARLVPPALGRLIRLRDGGTCRTPWCDAPIRHVDHVVAHALGGATSEINLQGLCEGCNLAKQAGRWSAAADDPRRRRHRVVTTTPTGHTYPSSSPPLPGARIEPTVRVDVQHHGCRLDYTPVA